MCPACVRENSYFDVHTNSTFRPVDPNSVTVAEHLLEMATDIDMALETQSGVEATVTDAQDGKHGTVEMEDENPSFTHTVVSPMDVTRMLTDNTDVNLGDFFSRPVKIANFTWGTGTELASELNPWVTFFENKRVANRINNFNLLRAKLHVKFMINGNGFFYGRAMAAYQPFHHEDALSNFAALSRAPLVQLSQLPHIFLDPTTNAGGQLDLPWFFHADYANIPVRNWNMLGRILLRSMTLLKHANNANEAVTISVLAWASDVELSVPTAKNIDFLSPQSGYEEIDEANAKGVISGPATSLARIARMATTIPPIAPFAMATSQIASGTAAMAKLFGYSRPPETRNPDPYRPTAMSQLATTTTPDTALKLSVDDKQELSIDPRIAGLDSGDPLGITSIATRESYLTQFEWRTTVPIESMLWNCSVNPVLWAEAAGTPTGFYFPACAVAAMPFERWSGSMTFRFQVVCSAFHKGRIRVVYDPNGIQSSSLVNGGDFNVGYSKIVDIAEESDFSITVGHGMHYRTLTRPYPGINDALDIHSDVAVLEPDFGNGVIGVTVMNELTTPNSSASNHIQINVFVKMEDDFQVYYPGHWHEKFVVKPPPTTTQAAGAMTTQSGMESSDKVTAKEPSAPTQSVSDTTFSTRTVNDYLALVYGGERIASFRQLLKRYNLHERVSLGAELTSGNLVHWQGQRMSFPYLRGYVDGAVHATVSNVPYSYCNTILMHWVVLAFQGWRGSIRRKLVVANEGTSSEGGSLYVTRTGQTRIPCDYVNTATIVNPVDTYSQGAFEVVRSDDIITGGIENNMSGSMGTAYTNTKINPTLEFEVPYYNQVRFDPGKKENWTTGQGALGPGFSINARIPSIKNTHVDVYVAAGEDFTTYFWTGLPVMYFENGPPIPDAAP